MSVHIDTTQIDDELKRLDALEARAKAEALREVVLAGAQAAIRVWKGELTSRGYVSSRRNAQHMVDAIDHTRVEENAYGASCEVYPLGEDDRGVRQRAKVAYIENGSAAMSGGIYGRHKTPDKRFRGVQGRKIVSGKSGVQAAAEQPVLDAMAAKIKEIMGD